ncbi:MAG: MAE_28990/MAE_18760 family HEPN-like nuclease [Cyclobacteriaceae bacterium]
MKIRSAEELQTKLDDDFAWRRKELTAIFTNVQSSKPLQLNTNIRIGVVMLYAHWEGFIKNAAELYLVYVACKKLNYDELSNNFIAVSLKSKLKQFEETNKNTIHTQLIDFLLGDLNSRATIPTEDIIKTQSNLNSGILREILSTIGVNYIQYELKEKFIDSQLLRIRNSVAHGQSPDISENEFYELYSEITVLMSSIKTDISNNATLSNYRKKNIA